MHIYSYVILEFTTPTVQRILTFEIPSSSNWVDNSNKAFSPNYYVEITNSLKNEILLSVSVNYVNPLKPESPLVYLKDISQDLEFGVH